MLVAAFLPNVSWGWELNNLRLVLFNAGAIAIAIAVHRRQVAVSRRLTLTVASAVVLANAWYMAMVVMSIGRPQFPAPDPEFRLVMVWAGVAMWWADAAFGLVTWRLGAVMRWGALMLAVGSAIAFTGMGHLEMVRGDLAWLFGPASQVGIALNGLGWILLGVDVAFRRRRVPGPDLSAPEPAAPRSPR